jgi:hypothetical protein
VFISNAKKRRTFPSSMLKKKERLSGNNRAEHGLGGCPVLQLGYTSRYLKKTNSKNYPADPFKKPLSTAYYQNT